MDLRKGTHQSEVTFLNGAISRVGAEIGVETPINRTLTQIIDGIARGELAWSLYRNNAKRLIDEARPGQTQVGHA
jgi:hypothetical protein